jgi:geranylgeranyl pyrophosphate synthase
MEAATLTFADLVGSGLAAVEARMREASLAGQPALEGALEQLLNSRGKRLRPILVLLTAGLLEADYARSVDLAAAIELLHTATLVHDDLIDGALVRRGSPTLNARWPGGATVLIGDYLFSRAAELAAATRSLACMESFARTLTTIVQGELNQLLGSSSSDPRTAYFERVYAKTGSLFALSAEAPAMLVGAAQATQRRLRDFGRGLGIAFQIVDDVLDFAGTTEEIGKPVGSDLRNGLITLPTLCHLELNPSESQAVELLIRGELGGAEVERLIESIRKSGGVEAARSEAEGFIADCLDLLADLPAGRPEHQGLADLASYVLQRSA